MSDASPASRSPHDLPRSLGFWSAVGVMIGVTVGSGIFRQPPELAKLLGSPWVILLLWVAGGVLSLCGALVWAELCSMYPKSGGLYNFLNEGFGPAVAFIFGWTYMLITKPSAAAAIAYVFSEHTREWAGVGPDHATLYAAVVTCVVLTILTAINAFGTRLGAGVNSTLTIIKIGALLVIVLAALLLGRGDVSNFRPSPAPGAAPLWLALAPAMSAVLWTYDGWSDAGSIAGEIRDPRRQLPRIFLLGTLALTALYVAVNAVYLWMVPLAEMRGAPTIGPLVMSRLVGEAGDALMTALVLISTLGATHAAILTGARISFAQARDGLLFRFLGRVHPRHETPHVALWSQLVLSCLAVVFLKQFNAMANTFVFTMWIFYGLGGVALFVLRAKRPELERPFHCWGYPVVPALFVLAAFGMTSMMIYQDPWSTLPWVGLLIAGWPMYRVWTWACARPRARA